MENKLWIITIIIGTIIAIGSPIVDLALAFNGIFIPMMLGWSISMIGVCIISLGAIFGVGSIDSKSL